MRAHSIDLAARREAASIFQSDGNYNNNMTMNIKIAMNDDNDGNDNSGCSWTPFFEITSEAQELEGMSKAHLYAFPPDFVLQQAKIEMLRSRTAMRESASKFILAVLWGSLPKSLFPTSCIIV